MFPIFPDFFRFFAKSIRWGGEGPGGGPKILVCDKTYNIHNIHILYSAISSRLLRDGNFYQSVRGEFSLKLKKNLSEKKGYDLTFPNWSISI